MPVIIKYTLALLALYLTVLIGLGFVMEGELRATARQVMNDTAQGVRAEVVAALYEPSLKRLLGESRPRDRDLTAIIASAAQRFDPPVSIEVVNARGKVVTSIDTRTRRAARQPADAVFKSNAEPILRSSFKHRFQASKYLLMTPLMQQHRLLGYIRIGLSNRYVSTLYHNAYLMLLFAAIVGFTAIMALGMLLQVRFRRVAKNLAALMAALATGEREPLTVWDREFAEAHKAAGRLRNELQVARELATSTQNKLDALANSFDVGIILTGPPGAPDFINQIVRKLLVGDHAEAFDRSFSNLLKLLDERMEKSRASGGQAFITHIEIADAAGAIRRLRVEFQSLSVPGGAACMLIIKDRDLIDALDADLRAATRARSLSRLYAAAAHEIKAPLNAISLQLEMLKRSLNPVDPNAQGRQQHAFEVLNQESKRLNRLLDSVLGQGALGGEEFGAVDLRRLVDELQTLLKPQARQQRVSLEIARPTQPVPVFGNTGQLKQALLNVTLNALESVSEGGYVNIDLRTDASLALLTIRDDGPGIPDAVQASIFDMHFTTKNTGTGIGLYIARAVTQTHGGEIRVQSEPGAGACFTISLPLHRANHAERTTLDPAREFG